MNEKERLIQMCGEMMVHVLWDSKVREITGGTEEHEIRVWCEDGIVKAELKRRE